MWLWVVIPAAIAAGAAFFFTRRADTFSVATASVERLAPGGAGAVLTATGYVVAQRKAAVASKGTGRLEVLNVEEGDRVKTGDVIGRLEAADVEAALQVARATVSEREADLARAQAEAKEAQIAFDRAKGLLAKGLIAPAQADRDEARAHTAQAEVEAAQAALSSSRANRDWAAVQVENTYIRAPFDGTVLTKNADVGEVVAPFASSSSARGAVVTLADMASLEVEADVSESNIRRIRAGQPCLITLDALPADPYRGRVKKIVPTADRAKATVLTKVAFENPDERVLPEMSARVSFLEDSSDSAAVDTRSLLTVPAEAILEDGGRPYLFVARQGRAVRVEVETGDRLSGVVEVRSGVEEGQIVILDPSPRLKDGSRVEPKS